jgi:hypothetical protein
LQLLTPQVMVDEKHHGMNLWQAMLLHNVSAIERETH